GGDLGPDVGVFEEERGGEPRRRLADGGRQRGADRTLRVVRGHDGYGPGGQVRRPVAVEDLQGAGRVLADRDEKPVTQQGSVEALDGVDNPVRCVLGHNLGLPRLLHSSRRLRRRRRCSRVMAWTVRSRSPGLERRESPPGQGSKCGSSRAMSCTIPLVSAIGTMVPASIARALISGGQRCIAGFMPSNCRIPSGKLTATLYDMVLAGPMGSPVERPRITPGTMLMPSKTL